MAKQIVMKICSCSECPDRTRGVHWCNHPKGWNIINVLREIPKWCPLEDYIEVKNGE